MSTDERVDEILLLNRSCFSFAPDVLRARLEELIASPVPLPIIAVGLKALRRAHEPYDLRRKIRPGRRVAVRS